jgi:hypothetical protein
VAAGEGTTVNDIVRRYLAVWGEPDADRRRAAVTALWAPDGVEYVEGTRFSGYDALVDRVTGAYEQFVASGRYEPAWADDLTTHGDDLAVFTIQLRTGGEVAWAARVFLALAADGRIREDYQLTVQPLPS